MLAGARDFLTKPPMGDDLIAAVKRSGELAHDERERNKPARQAAGAGAMRGATATPGHGAIVQGRVVTVYSPKGGTGCTTLAVNLAVALHSDDTRVVLVDASMQYGDVAMFFNEQGKSTLLDIAPQVEELDPETIEEIMIKHAPSGVHILAAPERPEQADKLSVQQFSDVLDALRRMYAYVLLDTSSYLNDVTLSAIDKSDAIVLVTTQEIPAIKNTRLFLDLLQTMGVERRHLMLVLNKYDKRMGITPERIGENLKQKVSAVIPLDERTVIPSVNRGRPFMLDNIKTQPAAKGIFGLAEAVRARLAVLEAQELAVRGR
jgi:pilus assembly protein CpaE